MSDIEALWAIVGAVCTGLITLATWGFLTGKFVAKSEQLEPTLASLKAEMNAKFEQANKETSRAMSYVQTLESRLIREFVSRDLFDTRMAELRRNIDRHQTEIDRMSDDHSRH